MLFYKPSRKGSTIIPAVFLLLFIIMFGATLVKGVLLSANFTTRTLEKRQAFLLAESATNYICDTLAGTQALPLFVSLDTVLDGIAVGATVSTPVEIDGQSVNTRIKLMERTTALNKTYDTYTITSTARQNNISQSISRQLTAERTSGGLGDMSILGISKDNLNNPGEYSLGNTDGTKQSLKGSIRFESIQSIICNKIIVDGDLYLKSRGNKRFSMSLLNVEVSKNLYIVTTDKNAKGDVQLTNVKVLGDILVYTAGDVAMTGTFAAKNMYVYTENTYISDNALASSNIENMYLYSHIVPSATMKNLLKGTIHQGDAIDTIIDELYSTHSANFTVDVDIITPSDYDFTITGLNDFDEIALDFATKKVYNVLISGDVISGVGFSGDLNISGDGAVNIFCSNTSWKSYDLSGFNLIRAAGSTAAVNIIYLQQDATLLYSKVASPLEANLIVPNGTIMIDSASVNGIGIAKSYVLKGQPTLNYYFNSKVDWSDFGGGLPSLGIKSVIYTYGSYVK